MLLCYLIACIPLIVGAIFWFKKKEVVLLEWGLSAGLGFAISGIFHLILCFSMAGDTETWSGQLTSVTHYPQWVEQYEVAIYKTVTKTRTVGSGKDRHTETYTERVFSHYETRYRTHHEYWAARDSLRNGEVDVGQAFSDETAALFGGYETKNGGKSGFYSGDSVAANKTGKCVPTTDSRTFENRVRAAPSLFSFIQVPENVPVYEYPQNSNWLASDRLVGSAAQDFNLLEWDKMNARLGPSMKVNVIAVGFPLESDAMMGQYQQAKWVGGKKNDLVLCYGGVPGKATWAFVFGWTEKEIVKRNLETLLLSGKQPLTPKIEAEINDNSVTLRRP